jgi:hypothetical protein
MYVSLSLTCPIPSPPPLNHQTNTIQHRRHNPSILLLPAPRHVPGLARRSRRVRLRPRSQALPLAPRLPGRAGPHLRRLRLHTCLCPVAAHCLCGRLHDRPGHGEWQREQWRWDDSDDIGVVWVRVVYYRDDWAAGYDFEY